MSTSRYRHWFPPSGRSYELFDTSLFLFGFAMVGYVLTTPPIALTTALSAPLVVVSEEELGWALAVASLIGIVLSYFPEYLRLGYLLPRVASAFMTLNFLLALATITLDCLLDNFGHGFLPAAVDHTNTLRVSFLYALIFGWATRRLSRDDAA